MEFGADAGGERLIDGPVELGAGSDGGGSGWRPLERRCTGSVNVRPDGEIDAAGDDDEGDTDRYDAKERGPADDVLQIVAAGEIGLGDPGDDEDRDQQGEYAENLFQAALPVARCIMASSLRSARWNWPAMRPSYMTRARSDMPRISSISLEAKSTATPVAANSSISR